MYKAKAAGRNNYKSYSGTMKARLLQRLDMENELRRAIDEEHFELYYQPKVDVSSTEIVGAEALLRWNHYERGWISPAEFITVAEETGLILPLGKWVLQTACRQLAAWQDSELSDICVSVNVSPQQMYSDDLVAVVKSAVSDAGIRAQMLELEITESLFMRDVEATIGTLNRLKQFGAGLSVDDFGTGYSSLSYLKRFPIDTLKIDRSFVQDLHRDSDDAAICAAILAMAKALGLKVIAEGVELEEQLVFLRHHGCDQMQGFLFSKPLAATEFETLVLSHLDTREKAAS
jgi:EAL domain-containing protein (putative c-di-GMP-specific phosphodiesterase class I)